MHKAFLMSLYQYGIYKLTRIKKNGRKGMKLKSALVCSLAFVFALSGCATKVIPAYQAKSVSTYRTSDTKDGLTISIHPISDDKESDKYFGTNLIESGVLAVLVVARNADTGSSKVLFSDSFSFIQGGSSSSTKVSDQFGHSTAAEGVAGVAAAGLLLMPIVGIPAVFVAAKLSGDALVVKHNISGNYFIQERYRRVRK